ncbi:MAG: dTMP kinase [Candidatus Marinimicrobia bacterium]|nr:dTMP kinase [Candidatus Neomarinimicrobiota bacterium]MBL7022763.1 dTMP kinase [Candidatus Neomarinimicrobiota bacterium]MBL7109716.1 dTMP kinase [Candidatus Neomarinimicrobiota bacterium]
MNKLITFEGIDGSGKSTQIKLLCEKFDELGIQYVSVREPGGTQISEKIRDILLDKENLELSSTAESLLFLSARSQLVSEIIRPALKENKFVICDRYTDSTLAYQGYGRGIDTKLLRMLNDYATTKLIPELTFIVDIDENTSSQRRKDFVEDRMEAGGMEFLSRITQGYRKIVSEEPERCFIIDGSADKPIIFNQIWKIINEKYQDTK